MLSREQEELYEKYRSELRSKLSRLSQIERSISQTDKDIESREMEIEQMRRSYSAKARIQNGEDKFPVLKGSTLQWVSLTDMLDVEEAPLENVYSAATTGVEVEAELDITLVDVIQDDPDKSSPVKLALTEVAPVKNLKRITLSTALRPHTTPSTNRKREATSLLKKKQANKPKTAIEVDYSKATFVIRSSSTNGRYNTRAHRKKHRQLEDMCN